MELILAENSMDYRFGRFQLQVAAIRPSGWPGWAVDETSTCALGR
jgi:hypothetical protein